MDMIIAIYIVITLIINFVWWIGVFDLSISEEVGVCFCNPKWIYNHTKTNWFGTICLTVLVNVFFGPSALCYWFYKLCTTGRGK